MSVKIVTDSASDLSDDVLAAHGIEVVPLSIRFGADEYVDRQDLTSQEFWRKCAGSAVLPETAAPSPGAFEQAFRRAADDGHDGVVCINLSGDLSGTIQAARLGAEAAADAIPVRVVDSMQVSMAQGLVVLGAAKVAAQGKAIDDVAGAAEDHAKKVRLFATLDTLENLKKGGRIGGAQALLGSMLSIKPVIAVRDGLVEPESKQRTRAKSLRHLVEKVSEHAPVQDLAVIHAHAPDLDEFLDMLGAVHQRDQIMVSDVGAVIGTHAGPRAIGVAFYAG